MKLPIIKTGTEKQVSWASDIAARWGRNWKRMATDARSYLREIDADAIKKYNEQEKGFLEWISTKTDARWWIDRRMMIQANAGNLLNEYLGKSDCLPI